MGTTGKVDAQIQPALLGVERGLDHPPRLDHPQPGRKHLELVHTTALRYARSDPRTVTTETSQSP